MMNLQNCGAGQNILPHYPIKLNGLNNARRCIRNEPEGWPDK